MEQIKLSSTVICSKPAYTFRSGVNVLLPRRFPSYTSNFDAKIVHNSIVHDVNQKNKGFGFGAVYVSSRRRAKPGWSDGLSFHQRNETLSRSEEVLVLALRCMGPTDLRLKAQNVIQHGGIDVSLMHSHRLHLKRLGPRNSGPQHKRPILASPKSPTKAHALRVTKLRLRLLSSIPAEGVAPHERPELVLDVFEARLGLLLALLLLDALQRGGSLSTDCVSAGEAWALVFSGGLRALFWLKCFLLFFDTTCCVAENKFRDKAHCSLEPRNSEEREEDGFE